jgi:hypothetical protein
MTTRENDQSISSSEPHPHLPRRNNALGGIVLIALGLLFLADNLMPGFDLSDYWPVILIAIGLGLLWKSRQ